MRFNEYFSRFKPAGLGQIALGADVAPVDATNLGDENVCTIRWQHDFNLDATAYVVATFNAPPGGSPPVAGTVYVYDKNTLKWLKASEGVVRPGEPAYFDVPMIVPDVKSPFEMSFAFVPATIPGEAYPDGEYVFGIGLSYRTGQVPIATQKAVPDAIYPNEGAKLHISPTGYLYVTFGAAPVPVMALGPAPQDDPVAGNPVEISFEAQNFADGVAFGSPVSAAGDVVRPRASLYGIGYTTIVSEDGAGRLLYGSNTPWVAGYSGASVFGVRNDDATQVLTTLDGNLSPIAVDNRGAVFTRIFVPPAGAAPFYAEDSAHASGDLGVQLLTRRVTAPSSSAGTDGDYATLNTDADGYLFEVSKSYDSTSQSDRVFPIVDLASRRLTTPIPLIAAAMTIPVTSVWAGADLGPEMDYDGYNRVILWLVVTPNDATHIQVRCLAKHTSGGTDEYCLPLLKPDTTTPGAYIIYSGYEQIELPPVTGATLIKITYTWVLDNAVRFTQFQIQSTTNTGVAAVVNSAQITMAWS